MSLKSCFLLLALCTALGSSAQQDYRVYHKEIIRAESLFIKGEIANSLRLYRTLFDRYKPFARDCFIALQLSCLEGGATKDDYYFFRKAFQNGIPVKLLNLSPIVAEWLMGNPADKTAIEKIYARIRKEYVLSLDLQTRAGIMTLVRIDYTYHILWAKGHISDSLYGNLIRQNAKTFSGMMNKSAGLPGEHTIGIYDTDLDGWAEGSDYSLEPVFALILYRYAPLFHELDNYLIEAVKNGELHPRTYGLLYQWAHKSSKERDHWRIAPEDKGCLVGHEKIKPYNLNSYYETQLKNTAMSNNCRTEIGIASIEHDRAKQEFSRKHNMLLFFGLGSIPQQHIGGL